MSATVGDSASPGDATAAAPAPFEQTLAQLEALVVRLESGELPLDEALRSFEQGVRLTRDCQSALSAAQQRVQLLLQRGESAVLEEFDTATLERVAISPATASIEAPQGDQD